MSAKRRRVQVTTTPERVTYTKQTPSQSQTDRTGDALDHGLDSADRVHVWVDKINSLQVSEKYINGWRFVNYDEAKDELDERGSFLFRGDENNRLSFSHDLALMYKSRRAVEAEQKAAILEDTRKVGDTSGQSFARLVEQFNFNLKDTLSKAGVNVKGEVRANNDPNNGQVPMTVVASQE